MHETLLQRLREGDGVATRAELLETVTASALSRAVVSGRVARPHPGIYVDPSRATERLVRLRAALAYAGPTAALSHTTGLAQWSPRVPTSGPINLVVPFGVQRRGGEGLEIHRWRGLVEGSTLLRRRDGLAVVALERCLVDAWPLLPSGPERRAPLLEAIGDRRTTTERVRDALHAVPKLRDRAALRRLLDRLESGCRSELELWGFDVVFRGPELGAAVRQYRVHLGDRSVYLDMAFPDVLVAVELDGAAWHGSSEQRERDLRRDSALAALGWVVLRFSARRLHDDPAAVRREVLAVVRQRRAARTAA